VGILDRIFDINTRLHRTLQWYWHPMKEEFCTCRLIKWAILYVKKIRIAYSRVANIFQKYLLLFCFGIFLSLTLPYFQEKYRIFRY